jgi:hypothetical protein
MIIMDEAQIVADWLGMTTEQALELKNRLEILKKDAGGFGSLRIDVKRWQVYRISHVVEGKPVVFNEGKGEC